jgi:DNA polymerase III subunit delta
MPDSVTILFLHGADEYAIAAHIKKLCAGLGDPSTADMNISHFDGRAGLDYESLNSAVNAMPFLAPRRVVVLTHPISACSSAEARKKLLDFLEKAQPTTTIALVEYEEVKSDHWLMKWVLKSAPRAAAHVYRLPKHWEMPRWIEGEAKKLGGRIAPDAAARLTEMVGEDTRIASQELNKLLTYVNFERPVSLLDVERVSIVSASGNVFELVDALGLGDGKKAQFVLHQLLEEAEAFELWGMIIRQFRLLLQARELLDAGADAAGVRQRLGLHEFVAGKITNQAKQFSLPALESIYHKLLEIDEGAKTSQVPLELALDTLVVQITKK